MSALVEVKGWVGDVEKDFTAIAPKDISFVKEAEFALQIITASDFLVSVAKGSPTSLQNAVINLAAIGLTLNPAYKLAYLIPRKGKICLDISYIGLVKLATDCGSVAWVQADLVYKNDSFEFQGAGKQAIHKYDPFSERGEIVGAYCTAKLHDGDFLVTVMSIKELVEIRDRSEAWKNNQSGPWKTDPGEMMKKTVIKRASKLWPKSEKVQKAIDVINEHEGIDFSKIADATPPSEELLSRLTLMLANIKDGTTRLLSHISAKDKVPVNRIEDLSAKQVEYSIEFLRPYIKTGETV